jgi:hypothetical protein
MGAFTTRNHYEDREKEKTTGAVSKKCKVVPVLS